MINENGELFTDFYHFNSLVIGVFPHKMIHKTTWISPDHQTENQLDHIYISRTFRRSLQDVFSKRGADVGTYHNLVTGKIKFKLKRYHPTAAKPGFRYNTELLRDIKIKYSFQLELANRYQLLSNLTAADATAQRLDFSRNLGEGSRKEAEKCNSKQQPNKSRQDRSTPPKYRSQQGGET